MTTNTDRAGRRGIVMGAAARLARRVADGFIECHQAGRRMFELRTSVDAYLTGRAGPPDTYDEFLLRTSGLLTHEPPAGRRSGTSRRSRS
jgi:hypothetical protein